MADDDEIDFSKCCSVCDRNSFCTKVVDNYYDGDEGEEGLVKVCKQCLEKDEDLKTSCWWCHRRMHGDGLFANKRTQSFCKLCVNKHFPAWLEEVLDSEYHRFIQCFPYHEEMIVKDGDFFMEFCEECDDKHPKSSIASSYCEIRYIGIRCRYYGATVYIDDGNFIDFLNIACTHPEYTYLRNIVDAFSEYLDENATHHTESEEEISD